MGGEKRTLSFGITGEFITQIAREWFYSGEKSIEKIMEILVDSMTGTDTPKAQIRRYAEDILMGRAALKGNTAEGTKQRTASGSRCFSIKCRISRTPLYMS